MAPSRPRSAAATHDHLAGLPDRFLEAWRELTCPPSWRRLLVAVSGGPDSLALLHLLHETAAEHRFELIVAHADHGIHPDSGAVADAVLRAAEALGLPVIIGRLGLGAGASETAARAARQEWLEQTRRSEGADAVVFAHQRDDQVETILLRALAGSGPAGLAGILPRQDQRLHPLLAFSKSELVEWLETRGIAAWADPANTDDVHDRSWVRTVLLPLLEDRFPDSRGRLLRLGRQALEDRHGWDAALGALPGLDLRQSGGRLSVAALPLATYDSALAGALLQAAGRCIGCMVGGRRAARLLATVRRGRSGAVVELGGPWRAELAFGRIVFHRVGPVPAAARLSGDRGDIHWGDWRVTWRRAVAGTPGRRDGSVGWFIGEEATLRAPRPGDRIVPLGGSGRRPVVRLLQEARIERSRRAGWPLLEMDGELVWIGGVCRGQDALPCDGDHAWRIEVSGG
jgi:tRNA(Ile)-lysidine synthase